MPETTQRAPEARTVVRTFLIADVRGYTRFTDEHGDEAAAKLAAQFAALACDVVSNHEGRVIELRGDEALAVFASSRQALSAAVDLQEHFAEAAEADPSLPLLVGIGLDAGEAIPVEGGFRGAALNLAARLCSLAGPREVLASEGVIHLARKVDGLTYAERGAVQLKGFTDPVRVVQVLATDRDQAGRGAPATETRRHTPLPIGGFLGALPASPLVARQEELQRVLSSVDAVAGGSGRLVLLVGEPGVGKTRLAQEVTLQLRNREFLVAAGRCYEPQGAVPFYPFLEALGSLYAAAPSSIRSAVPQRWPYLVRLLPNENLPAVASSEGTEEQERLFWSVTGFLQAMSEAMPVALLLDDLHWADTTSLALLQHLARHTRAYRILLLGTYRDVEVGRQYPLERALRDLHREQLAERVAIRRLEHDGMAALIAATFGEEEVSGEFAELVYRHTEGNPFFTQEVLRALVERGDVYQRGGVWDRRGVEEIEVPESVRSVIGERLSRLSEAAQDLLREASVLGQTFAFNDLQGMGVHGEDEVEAGLEEAVGAGLIRETGRDQYGFNHALTQQTLYAELSGRRRRRLHLAAGEALEQAPERLQKERVAELAWHFLEGEEPAKALQYSLQAGDQAQAVYANTEAERHYRTALALADELADHGHRALAREKLGTVFYRVARYDDAIEVLERAIDDYQLIHDLEGAGHATALLGRAHTWRGDGQAGLARVEPMVEVLTTVGPSPALASLHLSLAYIDRVLGRYEDMLAAAETAAAIAGTIGDDRLAAHAAERRATTLSMLGRPEESISALAAAIPRLEALGELERLGFALTNMGAAHSLIGELAAAVDYNERARAVFEGLGDRAQAAFALLNLGEIWITTGEWDEAERAIDRAEEMLAALGSTTFAGYPLVHRGRLLLDRGAWEKAVELLGQALELAEENQERNVLELGHAALAELEIQRGEPEAAATRLQPLVEREGGFRTLLQTTLAWAYFDRGDVDQAEAIITEAVRRAQEQGDRLFVVDALRVQGMVQARRGKIEEEEVVFQEGIALARSLPYPYGEARILSHLAQVEQKQGKQGQAREHRAEALAIFRRLGAQKDIERTEQELAALD